MSGGPLKKSKEENIPVHGNNPPRAIQGTEKKGKTYNSNWMVRLGPKQVISLRNPRFLTGSPLQVLTIQTLDLKDSRIL